MIKKIEIRNACNIHKTFDTKTTQQKHPRESQMIKSSKIHALVASLRQSVNQIVDIVQRAADAIIQQKDIDVATIGQTLLSMDKSNKMTKFGKFNGRSMQIDFMFIGKDIMLCDFTVPIEFGITSGKSKILKTLVSSEMIWSTKKLMVEHIQTDEFVLRNDIVWKLSFPNIKTTIQIGDDIIVVKDGFRFELSQVFTLGQDKTDKTTQQDELLLNSYLFKSDNVYSLKDETLGKLVKTKRSSMEKASAMKSPMTRAMYDELYSVLPASIPRALKFSDVVVEAQNQISLLC
jgi:hypothetical protein